MFRKSFIINEGGYFGNGGAEDFGLWLRLYKNTDCIFRNIPESLIGYRVPVKSPARRSSKAYLQVSTGLYSNFIQTGNPLWLFGVLLFLAKRFFRSTQV